MRKLTKISITVLYILQTLFMIMRSKMGVEIINSDLGIYMYVASFMVSMLFLRVLWLSSDKVQNYTIPLMVIAYILCFQVQIILVLGLLSFQILGRYERTTINNVAKGFSILFIAVAVGNFLFIPTMVTSYQEAGDNVYRILTSEDGENIVIISNYATSSYGNRGYVEVSFNKKRLKFFRNEIAEHQMIYQFRMNYDWLDNDTIQIYDTVFRFNGNDIEILES